MPELSAKIIDDDGRECYIENIVIFYKHILSHHSSGISIHEESGHYFRVDDTFRNKIAKIVEEINK